MKKQRLLKATLAATMTLGTMVGPAHADRVTTITDKNVAEKRVQVLKVKNDLFALNETLQGLSTSIRKRDGQGSIAGSTAVVTAALSLALGYMAGKTLQKRSEIAVGSAVYYGALAVLGTAISALSSVGSELRKDSVEVDEQVARISELQQQVSLAEQKDISANQKQELNLLSQNLDVFKKELQDFKSDADQAKRLRLASAAAQAFGLAATLAALNTERTSALNNIGPIVMLAGNIGQLAASLTDEDADKVLAAIESLQVRTLQAVRILENE
ncbi:MAG: hypothetical protein ACLGGX_10130 [Bdellovibrionia bacterium]